MMLVRIWQRPRVQRWAIPLAIFLIALLPRILYPVSRPTVWSDRAYHFGNAILAQDWATTYQRYHPGVTVMWLSGIGLQAFSRFHGGLSGDQLLGIAPTKPGILSDSVTAAIIPVGLVISLGLVLAYRLLSRLVGRRIALVAALLIALDPFFITYSKVIHPDALMATFMLLSMLLTHLHLKEGNDRWLWLSGVAAGLGLLSKSPALFLVPYTALMLATQAALTLWEEGRAHAGRAWLQQGWGVARRLLLWAAIAGVVFFVLWPAMWVEPVVVLQRIVQRIAFHTSNPHPNPVFFNGQIMESDPGVWFYLATLAWKTTLITLPFLFVGLLFTLRHRPSFKRRFLLGVVAYVFFFITQMSIGRFKQMDYIMPAFPAMDIVAAAGLVWACDAAYRLVSSRLSIKQLPAILISAAILVQAVFVLQHHPYMGTHYNALLGGARSAQRVLPLQDQGEGLDLAGQYLSRLAHGQDETAVIHPRSAIVFQRTFIGRTLTEYVPWARYRVYYVNEVMRRLGDEAWQAAWEEDRQQEPLLVISFSDIPYVWVYGELPEDPVPDGPIFEVDAGLGAHITLRSAQMSRAWTTPGSSLTLALNWESDGQVEDSYVVFTHLLSAGGQLVAQQDNIPLVGIRPTTTWTNDEILEDVYELQMPEDVRPGKYELSVGMYDPDTLQRVPAFDADRRRLPEDRIVLGEIEVREAQATVEE